MARLKVKNVGPIKAGVDTPDGFLDFKGVTVFIGNQGSGKSTVAKIFSTLSWIEKALVRGDFTEDYIMRYNRFKKQLAYQNIHNYLSDLSLIEYIGDSYTLRYENSNFSVQKTSVDLYGNIPQKEYFFPKIMYVPAERNFVSSVDRPDLIKRLPLPLYTFMDEYEDAKQSIKESEKLPVGDISFIYKKQNKKALLVGTGFEVELLEASSGFQSLVPLILVTRYLSEVIKNKSSETRKEINREDEEKIRKAVSKAFENNTISEDVFRIVLEKLSGRFKYECFLNIVEEPEQNLFPESQKNVLNELLLYRNENPNNKLVITTHSPFIINFLSLAVQGKMIEKVIEEKGRKSMLERLSSVVPIKSGISGDDVVVYQLLDGQIKELPTPNGFPSSRNFLNMSIAEGNILFDQLLEIEQELL